MSLTRYYTKNNTKLEYILPIIYKSSTISLRLIDWFVTNYCKKFNVIINKNIDNNEFEYFNVYSNYRSQLKAFKKIQFDPFRRRERIDFYFNDVNFMETTLGQLNFFRWFLDNDLLDYISVHYEEIESDMILNQKESIKSADDKVGSKKHTKASTFVNNMSQYTGSTTISFS